MKTLLIFISLCLVLVNANFYQTCSTCNTRSDNYNYWWSPYYCGDASSLILPTSQYYSYSINSTATLYFNLCGPIDICENGIACIINSDYPSQTHILSYPNSDPYYYSPTSNAISINYYFYGPFDDYRSFSVEVECNTYSSFEVTYFYMYDDDDINITVESSEICDSVFPNSYRAPTDYTSLSGNIFMAGDISMFSMDSIATNSDKFTFEGMFYISSTYNSVKINGTLTNQNSETSQVQYLVKGNMGNGNPPLLVSYVTLPNQQSPQCVLLPNNFDDDDNVDWFGMDNNPYYSANRTYESVYYNKGTSMQVQTWTRYDPYITVMQRISDGMPVSVGGPVIAPFALSSSFISEIDWTSLSMSSLNEDSFDLPSSWGCQM